VRLAQGGDGIALDAGDLVVVPGERLAVSWDADEVARGDALDKIVIELGVVGEQSSLVCAYEDSGNGSIPASQLAFAAGSELEISVHRHRKMSLAASQLNARSIDGAVVEFDFAVTAHAAVAE
jgi:hypothetical protein